MRKKIVAGNWKMNGRVDSIKILLDALKKNITYKSNEIECVVFPPMIYLPLVQSMLQDSSVKWGAQNVYSCESGAYTGEVSAAMLKEYNCNYVLVGHSERRQIFAESEKFVADKYHQVKEHGMIPVLCIGETLEERENGKTEAIIAKQILAIAEVNAQSFNAGVIAYEPVWAIGTGRTATPEQVQRVHQFIRELVSQFNDSDANNLSLLYGGSVNETNARALFAMPDVDGGLVGGASLHAQQFVEIVKCIN